MEYRRSAEKLMFADRAETLAYKEGHRDARHAAAEIAGEADEEIAALKDEIHEITVHYDEELDLRQGAEKVIQQHKNTIAHLKAEIERKDEALKVAYFTLDRVGVFVKSKEKIKKPEGHEWFDEQREKIQQALQGKEE
jgi:hypothetical protein